MFSTQAFVEILQVASSSEQHYLPSANHLKFDDSNPILGSNHEELSCIFALITGDNVGFNLRADHGLHELVRLGYWILLLPFL